MDRRVYSVEEKERAVEAVVAAGGRVGPVAREFGGSTDTVRRWVLDRKAVDWAAQVLVHFGFLKRHGFRFSGADAHVWWERATYRSDRAAIAVIKDNQGLRVEVELIRLVDGELPPPEVFVIDSEPVNTFHVDSLIRLRQPDAEAALTRPAGMPTSEDQLKFLAEALRRHGADLFAGDLSVLDELERDIREYVRQHPQQVTLFLPDTDSDAQEADGVALVRLVVPEEIAVVSRRLRTPPGRRPR